MKHTGRLFNRNFVLLWQGQFVSSLGNEAFTIAMIFWVMEMTDSASLVGLLLMLSGIPAVIMGPIGGTIADRVSRRTILLITDGLSGVAVLALALVMLFAPGATELIIALIFTVAILLAIFSAFFEPAIIASIPDIVPEKQVSQANSLLQFSLQTAMLTGQALGGVLYRILSAPLLILFNGLSFLFSAFTELFIKIPQQMPPHEPGGLAQKFASFKRDLVAGLRFVWDQPGMRGLVIISSLTNFFTAPILVLLPFYVEDVLAVTSDWYGFLLAGYSAGSLIGFIVAGALGFVGKARSRAMIMIMLLEAIIFAAIAVTRAPLLALICAVSVGITSGFSTVYLTTLLQIATPGQVRGRVFGLLSTIAGSLAPIAAGLAGLIADLIDQNIPLIYQVCSAIILLLTLVLAANGKIRTFLAYEGGAEDREDETDTPGQPVAGQA